MYLPQEIIIFKKFEKGLFTFRNADSLDIDLGSFKQAKQSPGLWQSVCLYSVLGKY